MKPSLILLALSSLLLTGCSLWTQPEQPIVPPTTGDIVDETPTTISSERDIISPAYSIDLLSGSDIPLTYSGDFIVYNIAHLSTNKWTHFIIYTGTWSDFSAARESNMFNGETMSTTDASLSSVSFATLSLSNTTIWHHVQVPIDWTLLVHETNKKIYVLDFDDPSGMQNKMNFEDIQNLLPYIQFTE